MQTLPVALNGDGVYSIQVPDRFTTDGPFEIAIENLGQAAHVHLNVDDDLSTVAGVATTNHYVEGDSRRVVHVDVDPSRPETTIRGKLKIVVGHGSQTTYVTVTIEPPPDEDEPVVVDESLSKPPDREPEPSLVEQAIETIENSIAAGILPVIGVAVLAVLVAVAVGTVVNSLVVLVGVAVVFGAAVVAIGFTLR